MKRVLLALSAVLLLGGFTARDYKRAYRSHTKELKIYSGLATALIMRGTLLDADFRDALAHERQRRLGPSSTDHDVFRQRMREDGAAFHEVVFSADSPVYDEYGRSSFGDTDGGWRLRLEADGIEEPMVEVYRVRKPTPLHAALYEHLNQWSELYIARFTRTVLAPSSVELFVGSGYGNGSLRWQDG